MDNIYRHLVSKVFNYSTNDYNHRYGFDDENYNSKKQLETAVNNQKTYLYKAGIRRGSTVWIASNNTCFLWFATIIACSELGAVFTPNADNVIGLDGNIDIEELYTYKSKDAVFTQQIAVKKSTRDTKLYTNKDHYTAIKAAKELTYYYKGNILIVSHPQLQMHMHDILLPMLTSNNVKKICAIGVHDITQAKNKIEHSIVHLGIQHIIAHQSHKHAFDVPNEVKITYFD